MSGSIILGGYAPGLNKPGLRVLADFFRRRPVAQVEQQACLVVVGLGAGAAIAAGGIGPVAGEAGAVGHAGIAVGGVGGRAVGGLGALVQRRAGPDVAPRR